MTAVQTLIDPELGLFGCRRARRHEFAILVQDVVIEALALKADIEAVKAEMAAAKEARR